MGKMVFKKGQKIELGTPEAKGARIMIGLSCGDCTCEQQVKDIDVDNGVVYFQNESTSSCPGECSFHAANHADI